MSEPTVQPAPPPGICLIKPEFLVTDHERSLSSEHVAKEDLARLDQPHSQTESTECTQQVEQDGTDSANNKRIKLDKPTKKLKGQNKDRRGGDRSGWKSKPEFCPSLTERLSADSTTAVADAVCSRGEGCKFQHDAQVYLADKPADIGSECYVYRLTGHCPWGISCRFGGDHLTKEGANLINESLRTGSEPPPESRQNSNPLDKETVTKLWKKRYDFTRSNGAVKRAEQRLKQRHRTDDTQRQQRLHAVAPDTENTVPPSSDTHSSLSQPDRVAAVDEEATRVGGIVLQEEDESHAGAVDDTHLIKLTPLEKKKVEWRGLLYLSPLTTVGNLPFRRICVEYGADVTCSEMTLALSLLQGTREWSLLRRHPTEKIFGVQICGNNPVVMTKTAQLLEEKASLDFVDINLGCPIDALYQQGCGSGMMARKGVLARTCEAISSVLTRLPLTVKLRTGLTGSTPLAHSLMPLFSSCGVSLATVHGRSREQRYTRNADWSYIDECARAATPMPVFGNGDVLSYQDYHRFLETASHASGAMIGRGALIKPWIFTEIKERRHWDISSAERFDIIKKYVNYGLEHWGSDTRGVETTRRFLLEWLSFLHRYVPVGVLERPPQLINQRPPVYRGRDDLETLLSSANCSHWIRISEMLLGPVPEGFVFLPKHKSNAWK